ncbi:MAG: CerR family C-terminal domain-containing protein [Deltaproteobacteria bacterium]|jgi:AcrR family transcriptional regulator|nr:CerR family C-terminal domain-containing protein [Deltaproteobacteria bacterium]MBW2519613.1 CerR family C-terminal domain-containing protein [Deltaproteobacteria bacterium]
MDTLGLQKDTKSALLDCAEQLFLEKGFERVSIREITEAAGANVAAVNYYFTSKTNLYRAFISRRFATITRRKVSLLKGLLASNEPPTLNQVVAVFVRSYFDDMLESKDSERLLQLVFSEMDADGIASDLVIRELVVPIHTAMLDAMKAATPSLAESHLSHCISSIVGQVLHFIRARDVMKAVSWRDAGDDYTEQVIEHITEFSLRGIGSGSNA